MQYYCLTIPYLSIFAPLWSKFSGHGRWGPGREPDGIVVSNLLLGTGGFKNLGDKMSHVIFPVFFLKLEDDKCD